MVTTCWTGYISWFNIIQKLKLYFETSILSYVIPKMWNSNYSSKGLGYWS